LGHGDQSAKDIFTKINISFNGKPIDVAGGYYHSAIITDTNNAYTFGWNAIGQLGLGDFTDRYSPSIVNYTFNGNLVDVK
jgi:alpha-tubulin suppressor-like RCC1 family protein